MSLGSSDNLLYENDIIINGPDAKYAIYLYQGNDIPDVSDGRPRNNHIFDNSLVSDNEVVKMLNSDDTAFEVSFFFVFFFFFAPALLLSVVAFFCRSFDLFPKFPQASRMSK